MNNKRALTRRHFIGSAGLAVAATMIPRVAAQTRSPRVLTAAHGTAPVTNGRTVVTDIWGYDGTVPGPVIRVLQGDEVNVRLRNELEEATSIHWHGIRIDNTMDGSPLVQKPVQPGEEFDYRFTVPDAGTYWYHTHSRTYEQLERGLYGLLIVDEKESVSESFDGELELVFDDWLLDEEGQIQNDSFGAMMQLSHGGRVGNWGTVNGLNKPDIPVRAGARLRARIVNVCNARVIELKPGKLDSWIIALDGQPVEPVETGETLTLSPGQRVDLAIDIPSDDDPRLALGVVVRGRVYNAAWLTLTDEKALSGRVGSPAMLPVNPLAHAQLKRDDAWRMTLNMEGGAMGQMREAIYKGETLDIRSLVREGRVWAFNGVADMDSQKTPLFDVDRGTTVEIDIINNTSWPHSMHMHGHHFRVVEKEGQSVTPGPWRDTHLMQRGERHTIAFVADNPGRWLMHCHMAEHAFSGMTGWFNVKA